MYSELINKAQKILKRNVYTEDKDYPWGKYKMTSPCKGRFGGVWNWDSAFHAIGMTYFDLELAKEQIEGFFRFQMADGMLPDVIRENGTIEDKLSKPPVMAYAVVRIFECDGDMSFIERMYNPLVNNVKFWEDKRLKDGLFHYDAIRDDDCDDETYEKRVKWESGWDNSPRWDIAPQNFWAIDLNCFMVLTYSSMATIAKHLGYDSTQWEDKATALAKLINDKLWNDELKAYTDYNFAEGKASTVLTPASFMPLFIKIADEEKATCMLEIARKHFLPGMPTVAYDHPEYSQDYWRGPCWLNTAYFAAKGLRNYYFDNTAEQIRRTILEWVYNDGEFIHENYNALTGEGLCVDMFSWSAAFVYEFIYNF